MKAVWGSDYDFRADEFYRCPCCPECEEPVWKIKGVYRCLCCNSEVEVVEQDMKEWFAKREGTKTEIGDCDLGCDGVGCTERYYIKNPVTKKWQYTGSFCKKCGRKTIV